jgi:Tol biopolymer transport system component
MDRMSGNETRRQPSKVVSFETNEGTFMNVDVSPDGETLCFDLLGDIYLVPLAGGEAVPLTEGTAWDQAPRFSPDGKFVYFVSDRRGAKNIWRVLLTDKVAQQVTDSEADVMGSPNWSHDGSWLLAGFGDSEALGIEVTLHSIDPDTGELRALEENDEPWIDMNTFERHRDPVKTYSGVEAPNGLIYFSEVQYDEAQGYTVRLHGLDPERQTRTPITATGTAYAEYKPQLSHDGRLLSYFRQYRDRRTELRILDLRTGAQRSIMELAEADDAFNGSWEGSQPNYAFTPDDQDVVLWQNGKIHRVSLGDGTSKIVSFRTKVERDVWQRVIPDVQRIEDEGEAQIIRWPGWSRNGKTLVFAAIGYIWVMDAQTGHLRRLTRATDFEYMPALSPDNETVAYIGFSRSGDEYGSGRLMIASVDGGEPREILSAPDADYLLPNWSVDGQRIAVITQTETDDGVDTVFGWTPIRDRGFREVAAAPSAGRRANLHIFARYVGFDESGSSLLLSYPVSREKTVLEIRELDGSGQRTLAIGAPEIGGITPSPDLKNLALTQRNGTVWVVPFEASGAPVEVSAFSSGAHRISKGGGYYVTWEDPDTITFGFAQTVFKYGLAAGVLHSQRIRTPFQKPKANQPFAFKGARLLTMSGNSGAGQIIENGTLVTDGSRILAVGPTNQVSIPADAIVVDGEGKTIMPGLLDTHYHRIGGSAKPASGLSAFKLPNPGFSDTTAIRYGVTSAWEPAGPASDGSPATADLQTAGRIFGPRWSHSAMGAVGYPYDQLTSYEAALSAVLQHKELGVDTLKEVSTPSRKQRQWLADAARYAKLGIVAHLESFDGMMTRVIDGYTGGDHPHMPMSFYKDVQELLRQTGYIWTPNIVITSGTIGEDDDKDRYYWHAVLKKRPELERQKATTSKQPSVSDPTVPYSLHRVSRVAEQAAMAAKNGVHIGVSAHNMPGSNLHQEMWYLWKGGMPIEDVLRATTVGNAGKLGLQKEIGSLERGKIADFLVLDANPLDDILNTLSLKYTVQGGVVYDSATAQRVDVSALAEHAAEPAGGQRRRRGTGTGAGRRHRIADPACRAGGRGSRHRRRIRRTTGAL